MYEAETPPKPATLKDKKSIPKRNAATPHAGIWIGIGKSVNVY